MLPELPQRKANGTQHFSIGRHLTVQRWRSQTDTRFPSRDAFIPSFEESRLISAMTSDLRFAWRALWKNPTTTVGAVLAPNG